MITSFLFAKRMEVTMIQEEVENRTVNLAVRTGKVTAKEMYTALKAYMRHRQNKKHQKEDTTVIKGKQTVKELIGQGQGVSSMEIADNGLREFKRIANKYGVDFAIVKDKKDKPPKYTVFFKAKDADAITAVLKDYGDKMTKKKENERPSVLEKLKEFKEIVANMPHRNREKRKEQER